MAPNMNKAFPSLVLLILAICRNCNGQYYGSNYYGYNNPNGVYYGPNGQPYYGSNYGNGGSGYYAGNNGWWWGQFRHRNAFYIRIGHGVLASLAFVFFFPIGAILMRLIPGRFAVWVHAAIQIFAYILFIVAAALGFWMLRQVNVPFFDLLNHAHTIIGIIIFALILFQPFLGAAHHSAFRRTGRRSFWSHIHMWLGRILITMGMVNGGIGIRLAGNTKGGAIAYGVVAGIMWCLWMLTSFASEILRFMRRNRRHDKEHVTRGSPVRNVPVTTRAMHHTAAPVPARAMTPPLPTATGANGKVEHYA